MKLGIIGWGYWGRNYAKYLDTSVNASLTHVCDTRPEMLADAKKSFPHLVACRDAKDLLRAKLDGIIIATPATSHYPLATQFIKRHIPLLIEKPLASSMLDAKELVHLSRKHHTLILVGHTFLYNQAVRWLKTKISRRYFGTIYSLEFRRQSYGPIRDDVNIIWDFCPHDLSIATYLLGKFPQTIFAKAKRYTRHNKEDIASIILEYPGNVLVTINTAWLYPIKIRTLTLLGKNRMATFDDTNTVEPIRIYNTTVRYPSETDPYGAAFRLGNVLIPRLPSIDPLAAQIKHFVGCINGTDNALTPVEDGFANVVLLEAISLSLRENKEIDVLKFMKRYV